MKNAYRFLRFGITTYIYIYSYDFNEFCTSYVPVLAANALQ